MHRGNLYARWELARQATPNPAEIRSANCVSDSSRSDMTLALYELRVLTRDTALLRLAEEAIAATYAVKPRGEDLATVSSAEKDARHDRGVATDHAFLAATATI